jgi:ubiquinone/menaquinone biosynthesis C-methylase UbiE
MVQSRIGSDYYLGKMIKKYERNFLPFIFFLFIFLCCILINSSNIANAVTANSNLYPSVYEQRSLPNPDGIGKFYMGREIAHVMGHTGAGWLERASREQEEQPSKIFNALQLKPKDVVADIGAGTGYMSFRIASSLPQGKVLAVDIQPEMLEIIEYLKKEKNITNVETILATQSDPKLPPESVDLAFMVDAYHEFEYPREIMEGIAKSLKVGGRVALVEYRAENPFIMIKRLHKMTQKQAIKEMKAVGLTWVETKNLLPQQHLMIFQKH